MRSKVSIFHIQYTKISGYCNNTLNNRHRCTNWWIYRHLHIHIRWKAFSKCVLRVLSLLMLDELSLHLYRCKSGPADRTIHTQFGLSARFDAILTTTTYDIHIYIFSVFGFIYKFLQSWRLPDFSASLLARFLCWDMWDFRPFPPPIIDKSKDTRIFL